MSEKFLENKAELLDNERADVINAQRMYCDTCDEEVLFLMKDKDHEFSVGLMTILQCLEFAIRTGDLPKLPSSWIKKVEHTYGVEFEGDVKYFDDLMKGCQ